MGLLNQTAMEAAEDPHRLRRPCVLAGREGSVYPCFVRGNVPHRWRRFIIQPGVSPRGFLGGSRLRSELGARATTAEATGVLLPREARSVIENPLGYALPWMMTDPRAVR